MSELNDNITIQDDSKMSNKLNINFILSKIEQIIEDSNHIKEALDNLSNMQMPQGPGDIASQGKALSIGNIVEAREQTNRQILKLLEKMYDDLRPKDSFKNKSLEFVEKFYDKALDQGENILDVIEAIRHL